MIHDCVIVGGGPAGLNAALVLGRSRRTVALIDANLPRNAVTHESHGFLTRDGIAPTTFRTIAYDEILRYPTVEHRQETVTHVEKVDEVFTVRTETHTLTTRKLLITTGLKEILPDIRGVKEHYGKSLFYCPYCDGWEMRDRPLIVASGNPGVFHLAKLIYNWSRDVVVCTNGESSLSEEQHRVLASKQIPVYSQRISSFVGVEGNLQRVEFTDGSHIERTGGFVVPTWRPQLHFLKNIDCKLNEMEAILTDSFGQSSVQGLFAAGEAATGMPTQLIIAAASGSIAASRINLELTEADFAC